MGISSTRGDAKASCARASSHYASDIDEYLSGPCQNSGTCTEGIDSYSCACVLGFRGSNCASDIDECLSSPCQNSATCTNGADSYGCTCVAGYDGTNCASWSVAFAVGELGFDPFVTCDLTIAALDEQKYAQRNIAASTWPELVAMRGETVENKRTAFTVLGAWITLRQMELDADGLMLRDFGSDKPKEELKRIKDRQDHITADLGGLIVKYLWL